MSAGDDLRLDDPAWEALVLALPTADERPPTALRDRLLASLDAPSERFAPFAERLAALIDVGAERARELLAALADPSRWVAPFGPGIALFHLEGGPAVAGADVGFVRVAPGVTFPHHRHLGDERVLLLQGRLEDSEGVTAGPGALLAQGAESAHAVTSIGDEPLIYAVVVFGVDIPGVDPSLLG
ncbi:MAG: cupin domain-containing protein [Myxococcales bacterium]|nr:cupin domain-containing protein [Myxococcales bacterium]